MTPLVRKSVEEVLRGVWNLQECLRRGMGSRRGPSDGQVSDVAYARAFHARLVLYISRLLPCLAISSGRVRSDRVSDRLRRGNGPRDRPQGRRWPGRPRWGVFDLVSAALFNAVFVLLVLIVTSLADSLAASGRRAVDCSAAGSRQRERIVALLDSPTASPFAIGSCPDNMPCEDPRRNSQLSREMNFYRERHCSLPGETPLCLVPPPNGYRIPVPWPESLHKVPFALYF
ncbi:hypothetical protein BHM03_00034135 [Ensete ventricosum]|nr:hypothetical protein BHM03_00034135 [Ensete ventricosum]